MNNKLQVLLHNKLASALELSAGRSFLWLIQWANIALGAYISLYQPGMAQI